MPIIIPVYDEWAIRGWFNLIKYYIGTKLYDAMAGKDGLLCPTYYLSSPHSNALLYVHNMPSLPLIEVRNHSARYSPHLKQPNMTGSIVYFDGIHNDARMCLNIAMTAAHHGANVANYVQVVDFVCSLLHSIS